MHGRVGEDLSGSCGKMRLLILTIRTPGNIYLANRLSKEFYVAGMVILKEEAKSKKQVMKFWARRVKRYGFLKALNRYLYLKTRRLNEASKSVEKAFFWADKEVPRYEFQTDVLETTEINSDEVASFIKARSPDVIAVCGSKVIKPEIFRLALKGTINIHCGITPDYRSAHPLEWALYNRDFGKIGVTAHFVDEGVDTGDIIYQKIVKVEKGDSVSSLYAKSIVSGADLMIRAIRELEKGGLKGHAQPKGIGRHFLAFEYGYLQQRRVNHILRKA